MSEHSQRLGLIPDTKHPMRVSESKSKLLQACDLLQPWRREQRPRLCTVAALAAATLAAATLQSMAPRARGRVKLRAILLATVAAARVALVVRPCRGATRMVGRVLILIAMLSTASGWKLPSNDARDRRRLVASDCDADWCAARPARASPRLRNRCLLVHSGQCYSTCASTGCGGCDWSCDESCDWFGESCDTCNGCDGCCNGYVTCSGGDPSCDSSCDDNCPACPSGQYGTASMSLVARVPLRSRQAAHARARGSAPAITHRPYGARARAQVRARRFATRAAPSPFRGAPRV